MRVAGDGHARYSVCEVSPDRIGGNQGGTAEAIDAPPSLLGGGASYFLSRREGQGLADDNRA